MNWNSFMRRSHRFLSLAFTLAVVANAVALAMGAYTTRLGLVAVVPLGLLLLSGLYLFALPYVVRWRIATPH